jgi:hypothetical protein
MLAVRTSAQRLHGVIARPEPQPFQRCLHRHRSGSVHPGTDDLESLTHAMRSAQLLVVDDEVARRRQPGRQRRVLLVDTPGADDSVAESCVPVVQKFLRWMSPSLGTSNSSCIVSNPRSWMNRSAKRTSRRPMPTPRCPGSAASIPNSPTPPSSRWIRTLPTIRPSSRATAISPPRMNSVVSEGVVRAVLSRHSPSSAMAYTRFTRFVTSATASAPASRANSSISTASACSSAVILDLQKNRGSGASISNTGRNRRLLSISMPR